MLTGDNPENGKRMQDSVQLAVDQYNAKGGVLGKQIELEVTDDQTDQAQAVTCIQKLASDGVAGIVGPHRSTNAIAVSDTVAEYKIPILTGGTSPAIQDLNNDYIFRCRASDTIQANAAVAYAVEKGGAKNIGIMYDTDEFGSGAEKIIAEYCEKNGITYKAEGHNTGATDFSAQLMDVQSAGCDTLIIWCHDAELAMYARQITEFGLNVKVVSSPGVTMDTVLKLIDDPAYIAGWHAVTDFVSTSDDDTVKTFVKEFEDATGTEAELYASSYYGAAVALIEAIKSAGSTDPQAVRDALAKTKDLQLPNGVATCDDHNNLIHSCAIAEVGNNKDITQIDTVTG